MDRQEIRMRCLEVAQAATKTAAPAPAKAILEWAAAFETFVVGADSEPTTSQAIAAAIRVPRTKVAPKPEEPTP